MTRCCKNQQILDAGLWILDGIKEFYIYPNVTLICKANYEDRRKAVAFARSMLDA